MEGKPSVSNSLTPDGFYGILDLQGSMQVNHQQNPDLQKSFMGHPQQVKDKFRLRDWNLQEADQLISLLDYINEGERVKNSVGGDGRENAREEGVDGHNEGGGENNESPWKRLKWTDQMVKLLITAVSYIGEGGSSEFNGGGSRNLIVSPKKGKWRAISKVLVERGCQVSPQQCEDKFNDMNKKYKRLNDILGRGTSCKVVDSPALLDLMELSDEEKENVRKILSSKQLFFQELCSYHNRNRLYLPHDKALKRSLQLALKGKDCSEPHGERPYKPDDFEEEGKDAKCNDDAEEDHTSCKGNLGTSIFLGVSAKRKKRGERHGIGGVGNSLNISDWSKRSDHHPPNDHGVANLVLTEGGEGEQLQNRWMISRSRQLEEQKLQIQAQMMELEKQRIKWLSFSQREDREMDKMRLENKCLKLENVRLALKLKRRGMSVNL